MDAATRQKVAEQIREARARRPWTLEQLATAANVSVNTVRAMEKGSNVQAGTLGRVLDALGIEPLTQTVARAGYPLDIEIVRDVLGMWLLDMDEEERAPRLRDLLKFIVATGNGDTHTEG